MDKARVGRWLVAATLTVMMAVLPACGGAAQLPLSPPLLPTTAADLLEPEARTLDLPSGSRLYVECSGRGTPTVLLEGGVPNWPMVQALIAGKTRVCSYDPAGYGRSSALPGPRAARDLALDTDELLTALGETRPVVVAAYSWGGHAARVFASMFPDRVAALVLIDASQEGQRAELARLGEPSAPETVYGGVGESDMLAAVRGSRTRQMPLVIVSQTGLPPADEVPAGVAPQQFALAWARLQARLAELAEGSVAVYAEGTGHGIPFEEPTAVAAGVETAIAAVRSGRITATR